jgi:hypothetical protein
MKLGYSILAGYLGCFVEIEEEKYILVGVRKSYDNESPKFMVYLSPAENLDGELVKKMYSKPTDEITLLLKKFEKFTEIESELWSKVEQKYKLISSKVSTEVWSAYKTQFLMSLGYDMHGILQENEDGQ